MRITKKDIEYGVARLNRIMGENPEPWTKDENGKWRANVGTFYRSGAYGGHCIMRLVNESGGSSTPIMGGHVPARQCFETLHAFINGI